MEQRHIYLDNSATTKICKEALDKYNKVSYESFGNPSSLHTMGLYAEKELDAAREAISASVHAKDAEVIFTASGSEANNLAILGRAMAKERFAKGAKIVTSEGEHASVSQAVKRLSTLGFNTCQIKTLGGKLDMAMLEDALDRSVILVSIMMVNNETGAVYDIPRLSRLIKERSPDAVLHVDATQSYMKIPFSMSAIGADMVTVSSHKIEGPKGVGALIINKSLIRTKGLSPVIYGGGQELGLRSGTENVPGIAAFGEAVRVGMKRLDENIEKMRSLREYLLEKLRSTPSLREISPTEPPYPAPHILNITLPDIKSETMLHYLSSEGIYVSSGSACSSNTAHLSSALIAYGRSEKEADCSIRISFSHGNTKEDVDSLCKALGEGLKRLARRR